MGRGGTILTRCRDWPRGSWYGKSSGGTTWTPAITLPQMRQGMALILYEVCQGGTRSQRLKEWPQRLQRHALARFYQWTQRNRWAPLPLYTRLF
jgi:hypothetical protein